jgi:hypothetical protein
VCLLALALLPMGCGYQLGYRPPTGVRTVSVPIFDNRTDPGTGGARRDLEIELTEAVVRAIQSRTPLLVVGPDQGDVVVKGALLAASEAVLVEGPDDEALLSRATFTIEVEVSGGIEREPTLLTETVEFPSGAQRFGTRDEGLAIPPEGLRKLAERVVFLLEGE